MIQPTTIHQSVPRENDEESPRTNPAVWIPAATQGNLFAVPLIYRVLIANSAFLLVGAFLGTALVVQTSDTNRASLIIGFTFIGIILCIIVNFVQLKISFFPLIRLRETMKRVAAGDLSLRAPVPGYDPDADALAISFNRMVARLEDLSRTRASQILRAQEEERRRIARELHDETSQALTSVLINLAVLETQNPNSEAMERITESRAIVHRTLAAIRHLSIDLRPSALDDLGLVPALRGYIKEYQHNTGIKVDLVIHDVHDRYSTEIETALYRIIQESLTNTAKHAHAQHVTIDLREKDSKACVHIQDDGQGFDITSIPMVPASNDHGLGLLGMRERAALLDGTCTIISHLYQGTTIDVVVPLKSMEGSIL
jgi:two-component system sensor histidine kinase UhpB